MPDQINHYYDHMVYVHNSCATRFYGTCQSKCYSAWNWIGNFRERQHCHVPVITSREAALPRENPIQTCVEQTTTKIRESWYWCLTIFVGRQTGHSFWISEALAWTGTTSHGYCLGQSDSVLSRLRDSAKTTIRDCKIATLRRNDLAKWDKTRLRDTLSFNPTL